jgi:hypothetical protein
MGRDAEPVKLSIDQLVDFANALRVIAAMIDADVESMRERGLSSITPKMWRSATNASSDLARFAGALRTALAVENFPTDHPP